MSDRLSEIKWHWLSDSDSSFGRARTDIAWLIVEVERLQSELAYLRDHPGWVPPIPERRKPE